MNRKRVLARSFLLLILLFGACIAFAEGNIHPFAHDTTTSYTSPPGIQIGCLTSCTDYTLYIDLYYCDDQDNYQRITSLSFQAGDGIHEDDTYWSDVAFPVSWEYSYDGLTWIPYSGTGDIDVLWSGKNAPGQLDGTEPHVTVRVTWHVTGNLGEEFYYRVHFTTQYPTGHPGNAGNHYFWYNICGPSVPEFPLGPEVVAGFSMLVMAYVIKRKRVFS